MCVNKIIFVSSYPPRECGIATFTKDLSDSIQKKFGNCIIPAIAAINESESTLYKYPHKVSLRITEQDIASYEKAAAKINSIRSAGIVNIQHEFGLFGGLYGKHILRFMELLNKKAITTFHTVLEKPDQERKEIVKQIIERSGKIVVMTQTARSILIDDYDADEEKIAVIPHGVPSIRFCRMDRLRKKYGVAQKNIILTFGLLSRGKGIENIIAAMPLILKNNPDTAYIVVGETHPKVRLNEGESYRHELQGLARSLGVEKKVRFLDKFLSLKEIVECLQMATVYVSPSLDQKQICSGTISYALGAGKAIVASQSKYNSEVLADGRGIIAGQNDPESFAREINMVLGDDALRHNLEKNAFEYSRKMTWQNVSTQYISEFDNVSPIGREGFSKLPRINFGHFARLTDDFGIIQFSNYSTPDQGSGYTLDDNARALAVSVSGHEIFGTAKMLSFADTFLSFIEKCQLQDGKFHNLANGNREFIDDCGSEDSFGRAVWSLGTCINSSLPQGYRLRARNVLEKALCNSSDIRSPRAQADALIGIINSAGSFDQNMVYSLNGRLIDSLISKYEEKSDGKWNWFEDYLTYGNSCIPQALFEANAIDGTGKAGKVARESMDFLTKTMFINGKLMPIGQEKWYIKNQERSLYDQQPIEAAGMTVAYLKAYQKTQEHGYLAKARDSFDWFLGKNSMNQVVYDEATGGCFDGLTRTGVNANEGAESTISYLLARLGIALLPSMH